jgi:hypothetical protein
VVDGLVPIAAVGGEDAEVQPRGPVVLLVVQREAQVPGGLVEAAELVLGPAEVGEGAPRVREGRVVQQAPGVDRRLLVALELDVEAGEVQVRRLEGRVDLERRQQVLLGLGDPPAAPVGLGEGEADVGVGGVEPDRLEQLADRLRVAAGAHAVDGHLVVHPGAPLRVGELGGDGLGAALGHRPGAARVGGGLRRGAAERAGAERRGRGCRRPAGGATRCGGACWGSPGKRFRSW